MTYGYARVSSKDQHEARQLDALLSAGVVKDNIVTDKESGKDFNRRGYRRLRRILKRGDLLVVTSLDRFGRDYDGIKDEWQYLTRTKGVDIKVLDMPILDTTQGQGLIGRFISDIVLQVLGFVAETERKNIKERQAQGIAAAMARGVKFGRPAFERPQDVLDLVKCGEICIAEAARRAKTSRTTIRRWIQEQN